MGDCVTLSITVGLGHSFVYIEKNNEAHAKFWSFQQTKCRENKGLPPKPNRHMLPKLGLCQRKGHLGSKAHMIH